MSGIVRYSYVWWLVCDAVFDLTVRCSRPGDNVAAEFSAYNQTLSSHLRGQTPIDNLLNDFELVNFIQSKKLRRMRLIQEKTLQLSHHNMSAHNVIRDYVKNDPAIITPQGHLLHNPHYAQLHYAKTIFRWSIFFEDRSWSKKNI